jgi:predicted enzyme related to lactoylglutathione lyase
MSDPSRGTKFAFTKLVVGDLTKAAAFYRAVCGYGEGQLVKADLNGRALQELVFRGSEGGVEFVLYAFLEGPPPPSPGEVITAFHTSDLEAFQARLLTAGGAVLRPIKTIEFGGNRMRIGFFTDLEGYHLEVIER